MQNITTAYTKTHAATAASQNKRFGNPITTPPDHVPAILEQAVAAGLLTSAVAVKLARVLGKLSYGEWGLSYGRVASAVEDVAGRDVRLMTLKVELSQRT